MSLDLNKIKSNSNYNKGLAATRLFDTVTLGKPSPDDFFKIYPLGELGTLEEYPPVLIAKKKDPEGKLQPYLIYGDEDFRAKAAEKIRKTQEVRLCYWVNTNQEIGIWPVAVVQDLNAAIGWHITGHEIAVAALKRWTQIFSDKATSRYIHVDLDDQSLVPKHPVFEKMPMSYELAIEKAFKNRIIDSEDHPVYRNAGSVVNSDFKSKLKGKVVK